MARSISPEGLELIKRFEGLNLVGYLPTPFDVPTAGYGHTGPDVQIGTAYTQEQADEWLAQDVGWAEEAVENSVTHLPFTQHEFDACVSLCFNIGVNGFAFSTLVQKLNTGDVAGAADQFPRWDRQHGSVLQGLLNRRLAERDLFLTP